LKDYVILDINKKKQNQELKNYDIYFMPSIKEGLPYVLLEAGLSGLPVVASDTGGIKEIIEDDKNGFLVLSKDTNNFAEALEKLILDNNLRKEFGKFSEEKIKKYFNCEKMINSTEKIYFFK
jgi:glycosyltransferase involved in cell wall biosynthesis